MEEQNFTPPPAPAPPAPYNRRKSLAIALAVSAVFLLAAAGICVWLLTRSPDTVTVNVPPQGDGSENVKKVAWIAPKDLPAHYVRRDQNTQATQMSLYLDATAGCGIATSVQPALADKSARDVVVDTVKANQAATGTEVVSASESDDYSIKDEDGQHAFVFPSVQLEQKIAVAGVPYSSQKSVIAFKQFGQSVASILYFCQASGWDAKKAELQSLINAFKVKTDE